MANLSFNILTFEHPQEELTLYFTNEEDENLTRIFHKLVLDEVIEAFGEQEHYYTSFTKEVDGFYPVTKAVEPNYEKKVDKHGEEYSRSEEHTSELQSRGHLVCRLLLEKKKKNKYKKNYE